MSERKKWVWPSNSLPDAKIAERLKMAVQENISYGNTPILGFPGTRPLPAAIAAINQFLPIQANNIGFHTKAEPNEMGFEGTQALEKEYVYSLASLLGSEDPEVEIDGYICSGGTEGNDHGIWLGRNWLWQNTKPIEKGVNGIVVMTSFLTHYSVEKEFCRLLGEEDGGQKAKEHLFVTLPTNENGQVDAAIVEKEVRNCHAKGFRRFLIVLTAGTINVGSIDRVSEIDEKLTELEEELGSKKKPVGFYVHVDAAYGGLAIPFLHPNNKFGFQNRHVHSMSVDAHKMGYVPYSAGVFLCRKNHLELTTTKAEYLYSHSDSTVPGSRNGAIAAGCWAAMHSMGFVGYKEHLNSCMTHIATLKCIFESDAYASMVKMYPSELNTLTIMPSGKVRAALERKDGNRKSLRESYFIPEIKDFPVDLTKSRGTDKVSGTAYRFLIMPHCTKRDIESFADDLSGAISRA